MAEYFVHAESFAAPFCSDTLNRFISGDDPRAAVEAWVATKPHPCGIYCAAVYASADDFHKGRQPLAKWMSNKCRTLEEATRGKAVYTQMGLGDDAFEIDGERFEVECPREGQCVEV